MNRRSLMKVATGLSLGAITCTGLAKATDIPRHRISAEQLQHVVAQRFPLRYVVPGVVDLDVKTPRLRLLSEENRLATELVVDIAGPALRRRYTGALEVKFALRHEASDKTIRAHHLEVLYLRLPGLPTNTIALFEAYLPVVARQAFADVVLHKLTTKDLALADAMGLQPSSITVTPDGLEIGFTSSVGS